MWQDLERPWQVAFEMAWEAYRGGTIPIGAVITDAEGNVVSRGRNRIYDRKGSTPLAGTNMAHAEMDALFGLAEREHPEIRTYILYTTLEPCPMCFGTAVMMNIRKIYFAARDGFAGATALNEKLDYIRNKNIVIKQGNKEMAAFQLILQTAFEYGRQHARLEEIMGTWRENDEGSVAYGQVLYGKKYFEKAAGENKQISRVYDEVIEGYILTGGLE